MTDDEATIERMSITYALISARLQDDESAYMGILTDESLSLAGMFLDMTDFAISLLKLKAAEMGVGVDLMVRSMAMINRTMLPEYLKERRDNGQ